MNIFGDKTDSLFDIWSIEHFVSGVTIGSLLLIIMLKYFFTYKDESYSSNRLFPFNYFTIILLIAYIWEVLEFYMEAGYTENAKVTYWFQGVEYWANRVITDPLMVIFGAWVAIKLSTKVLSWSARSFSVMWLGLHVLAFPHCMYLQDILYKAIPNSNTIEAELSEVITICSNVIINFVKLS